MYPDVFGESKDSEIANAMDKARGGRHTSIPKEYPSDAWYTYTDKTCDYSCQVTEYHYWALSSLLGAQENRSSEIQHEWKLNTAEKLKERDEAVYKLLTDSNYAFPTVLPDGNVSPIVGPIDSIILSILQKFKTMVNAQLIIFLAGVSLTMLSCQKDNAGPDKKWEPCDVSNLQVSDSGEYQFQTPISGYFSQHSRWESINADIVNKDDVGELSADASSTRQALEAWKLFNKQMPYD